MGEWGDGVPRCIESTVWKRVSGASPARVCNRSTRNGRLARGHLAPGPFPGKEGELSKRNGWADGGRCYSTGG